MSRFDYEAAKELRRQEPPFYALIMAAMWGADSFNVVKLQAAFPDTWAELEARYNAPGAILAGEPGHDPTGGH